MRRQKALWQILALASVALAGCEIEESETPDSGSGGQVDGGGQGGAGGAGAAGGQGGAGAEGGQGGQGGQGGACTEDECGPMPDVARCPGGGGPTVTCERDDAGACGWQIGRCPPPACGGMAGATCQADEFCDFAGDGCDFADAQGTCAPRPEGCTEELNPVCGCDGQTYENACFAQMAGVDAASAGPCGGLACGPDDCGALPPVERCPPGTEATPFVCGPLGDRCDWSGGECVPVNPCDPEACGPIPPFACDDGSIPEGVCEPQADGACGWTLAPCPEFCGGFGGFECAAGQYCEYEGGGCGFADGGGLCQPRPQDCPAVVQPVCGCDGMTYGNACQARSNGVDVQHDGPCDIVPGDLCDLPAEVGDCEAAIPRWFHNPATGACEQFIYGGCGGNGNNFETREACEARCVDDPLPPGGNCGGRAGNACGGDEFCNFANDFCDWADAQGVCQARPQVCPAIFAPVCGCDGNTYDNECSAQAAGTDAAYGGECEGPVAQCEDLSRDPIVLGGALTFGECLQGCNATLTIRETDLNVTPCDRVLLEVCDNGPDGPCTRHLGVLTPDAHDRARAIARALLRNELQPRYGCPDCADGGASTVRLMRQGVDSSHVYEAGNPPAVLGDADTLVQGLIRDLRQCQVSALVSPDPNCVPRR